MKKKTPGSRPQKLNKTKINMHNLTKYNMVKQTNAMKPRNIVFGLLKPRNKKSCLNETKEKNNKFEMKPRKRT